MAEKAELAGAFVLLVEDEYLVALDLQIEIERSGATVIGPVGRVSEALDLAGRTTPLDAAVLDVNLHGEAVFPVADVLAERGIPYVFATGQDRESIPERHRVALRLSKPIVLDDLMRHLAQLTRPR